MNTNANLNAAQTTVTFNADLALSDIESLSLHELEFVSGGSGCDNLGKV